jgi:hypothetical protein
VGNSALRARPSILVDPGIPEFMARFHGDSGCRGSAQVSQKHEHRDPLLRLTATPRRPPFPAR